MKDAELKAALGRIEGAVQAGSIRDAELKEYLDRLEARMARRDGEHKASIDRLEARMARRDGEHKASIDRLEAAMHAGFARADLRFERVDRRFDKVDARFDHVDGEIQELRAHMDTRFEHFMEIVAGHFEYTLTQVNDRLDRLEPHT